MRARHASTTPRVVEAARRAKVRLVRFLYTDNGGVTRVEGMGPVGEIRLVPDPPTFTVPPYAPHTAAMTADMRTLEGAPWAACPRDFLRRQIAACAAEGFTVRAAFECEFSLAVRRPDGTWSPLDESLCFSTVGMTTAAAVMDDIVAALEAQGIEVEQYYPELGHGQQELSIRHAPALAAADRQVFYRETASASAWPRRASCSSRPTPTASRRSSGSPPAGDAGVWAWPSTSWSPSARWGPPRRWRSRATSSAPTRRASTARLRGTGLQAPSLSAKVRP